MKIRMKPGVVCCEVGGPSPGGGPGTEGPDDDQYTNRGSGTGDNCLLCLSGKFPNALLVTLTDPTGVIDNGCPNLNNGDTVVVHFAGCGESDLGWLCSGTFGRHAVYTAQGFCDGTNGRMRVYIADNGAGSYSIIVLLNFGNATAPYTMTQWDVSGLSGSGGFFDCLAINATATASRICTNTNPTGESLQTGVWVGNYSITTFLVENLP